jgi:LTXXQ motif family protein
MKSASRYLMVGLVILSAAAVASVALARGGGGRGGGRIAAPGTLCLSGNLLELSLTRIDVLAKPAGSQKAAFDEFKKAAKEYSDTMSRACAGDNPADIPAKIAASDKRLEAALAGVRKLKASAEKFYATLNDEQKSDTSSFMDWPGL